MPNRTVKTQDTASTRTRFEYRKDRHYVIGEKENRDYDGKQLDDLLNETLPDGSDAYVIEADGANSSEERRITGGSRMVLLSCPKEYADAKTAESSQRSKSGARAIAAETDEEFERFEEKGAISINDLPNKEELEKKRFSA